MRSYVLEQHLHRDEMIRPHTKQLGLFKGTEAVFPRSAVVTVKSKENYWRVGRVIRDNVIPMKWVKARTVTINKKRAENLAMMDGEAPDEQPLYAEEQTELYVPPPVVDVSGSSSFSSHDTHKVSSLCRARFRRTTLEISISMCRLCCLREPSTCRVSPTPVKLSHCADA